MKRAVYLFIIIISIFAFAFFCREVVLQINRQYNDMGQRSHRSEKEKEDMIAMDNASPDLMGGIVVGAEAEFEHRFFYVGLYNGCVTVFNRYGSICFETGIPFESVDIRIRKCLSKRIYFEDIADAEKFVVSIEED